jgi:hypothetical protein
MSETVQIRHVSSVSHVEDQEGTGAVLGAALLIAGGLLVGLTGLAVGALVRGLEWLVRGCTEGEGAQARLQSARGCRTAGRQLADRIRVAAPRELKALERRKAEVLASIAPYMVRAADVERYVRSVVQARAAADVERAARVLHRAAEGSHNRVLLGALGAACRKASVRAGFPSVRVERGSSGWLRVVAEDGVGRALVSEVRLVAGEPRLAAEVVGVADASCHAIMNRYLAALGEVGVRFGAAPVRTPKPVVQGSRERAARPGRVGRQSGTAVAPEVSRTAGR